MAPTAVAPSTRQLRAWVTSLQTLAVGSDNSERVERLRLLEELKSVACAAQAAEAVALDQSRAVEQTARAAAQGFRADASDGQPTRAPRHGRGVIAEIGLALRISPWQAQRWLGWATILTAELPATYRELRAGRTNEWRTKIVARETACLPLEHRARIDAEIAPKLEGWGDRRVDGETRRAAYRLDPHAALARARQAESDRNVTIRPAPDTMVRLSTLLPVIDGVACYAALTRHADLSVGAGQETRSRAQVMADTLVDRLTGRTSTGGTQTDSPGAASSTDRGDSTGAVGGIGVEINLIMTDTSLLAPPGAPGRDEPAWLLGYGPIPAGLARDIAVDAGSGTSTAGDGTTGSPRWLRRLYRHPDTGRLAAMDTRRRLFTDNQRHYLRVLDRTCRTPYCDAPIRHTDHVRPHAAGGPTTVDNGQSTCTTCNLEKTAPGWTSHKHPDGSIDITTPNGQRYRSRAPDPPGISTPGRSPTEIRFWHLVNAA